MKKFLCFYLSLFLISCGRFSENDFKREVYNRLVLSNLIINKEINIDYLYIKSARINSACESFSSIIVLTQSDVNFYELEEIKDYDYFYKIDWFDSSSMFGYMFSKDEMSFIRKKTMHWFHWKNTLGRPFLFLDEEKEIVYIVIDKVYSTNPRPYLRDKIYKHIIN